MRTRRALLVVAIGLGALGVVAVSSAPAFAQTEPGIENPTVTPIPGDLCYFSFPSGMLDRQFKEEKGVQELPGVIDLALFYGRNNLLLNADVGWVVGNVFATIVEGLEEKYPCKLRDAVGLP